MARRDVAIAEDAPVHRELSAGVERDAGDRPRLPRLVRELLVFLRSEIRASEIWLVIIAAFIGAGAGLVTVAIGVSAHTLQRTLYALQPGAPLSAASHIDPWRLVALPAGGGSLVLLAWLWARGRATTPVDPVEANALRGGRMSFRDSVYVGIQTILSNGVGGSVGLEAAYAQMGGGIASVVGRFLNLRRSDLRTFVGAGAGAAIGAAFNAPLTGAFYAFEIIIGSYTIANVAPVVAASLVAVLVTRAANFEPMVLHIQAAPVLSVTQYLLFAALGLVSAFFGVALMRLVGWMEMLTGRWHALRPWRPLLGGALLAGVALFTPQVLSSGHGALHLDLTLDLPVMAVLFLLSFKSLGSIISLGSGFRGGLFFASLFMGSLLGRLYAEVLGLWGHMPIDPLSASLVGMGALAVAIIGGPFTMSFLVLETTGDFDLTAATFTASIVASLIVRETFGYSFSTWRLHLRGETIRSAHDVGFLRTLTAGRMMRPDAPTIAADAELSEFRRRFPLGSTQRVVALDGAGGYAGLVMTASVYADEDGEGKVEEYLTNREEWLTPDMSIRQIMSVFDRTESDALAVLGDKHQVLGVVTEAYATRRYAEELEKNRRDLVGGE
jgi:CIC family chloride channel protein